MAFAACFLTLGPSLNMRVVTVPNASVASSADPTPSMLPSAALDVRDFVVPNPLALGPLIYSTFLGGTGFSGENAVAAYADPAGGVVVAGYTNSPDFPTTPGAFDGSEAGGDVFLVRLSSDGSSLIFATFLGGTASDVPTSVIVDSQGYIYVSGITESSDFPTTPGAYDRILGGQSDVFVAKLTPDASGLVWATLLGGMEREWGGSLSLDSERFVYLAGVTLSLDFPATAGALDRQLDGVTDGFVAKLNETGGELLYATFLGGTGGEEVLAFDVDEVGAAYVTGFTDSPDYPTTPGAFDRSIGNFVDAFITKVATNGATLAFSTFLGGDASHDVGYFVDAAPSGDVVVIGSTGSFDFPTTPAAFDTTYNGGFQDCFLAKLSASGGGLIFSSFFGGSGDDVALDGSIDRFGHIYLVGSTESANFPTTNFSFDRSLAGQADAYVIKLSADATSLLYSTFLGGQTGDFPYGAAVDAAENAYVTGWTGSSDFPTTPGAFDRSFTGAADAFVTKVDTVNDPPTVAFLTVDSFEDGSAGASHIVSDHPRIVWTFDDPEGYPQVSFDTRVGTGPGLEDVWSPGPRDGTGTNVISGGAPLIDGTEYYVSVRLSDGERWSGWKEIRIRTNTPPPAVSLLAPGPNATNVQSGSVDLGWTAVADSDGDSIAYFWIVSEAPNFTVSVGNGTSATALASVEAEAGTTYYWRVVASDGWQVGANSSVGMFRTAGVRPGGDRIPLEWWLFLGSLVPVALFVVVLVRRRRGRKTKGNDGSPTLK